MPWPRLSRSASPGPGQGNLLPLSNLPTIQGASSEIPSPRRRSRDLSRSRSGHTRSSSSVAKVRSTSAPAPAPAPVPVPTPAPALAATPRDGEIELIPLQSIADEYSLLTPLETAERLQTSLTKGLTRAEAIARLHDQGPNELPHEEPEPLWLRFVKQFKEPLILLLLCSAGASMVVGNKDDAISIAVAVTIVVSVGFIQEYRSEKSIEALSHLVPNHAHLIRGDPPRQPSQRTPTWPPSIGEIPEREGLMDGANSDDDEAKAEAGSSKVMAGTG
jgi:Ca2+-transporting ATPase